MAFVREVIPINELREGAWITLAVAPEGDLPVVEVRIRAPKAPVFLQGMTRANRQGIRAVAFFGRGEADSIRWFKGEIPPGNGQMFTAVIRYAEASVGDTIPLPVLLLQGDSSVVEWAGPPGSPRPAPTIVVGPSSPFADWRPALLGGVIALGVLLLTGLVAMGRRWHYRRSGFMEQKVP